MSEETRTENPNLEAAHAGEPLDAAGPASDVAEDEDEVYGWEFHKLPLAIAAVLTLLFYAFVFFYVHY